MFLDRVGRIIGLFSLIFVVSACTPGHPTADPAPATVTATADYLAVGTAPPSAPASSPLVALGLTSTTLPSDSALVGPHYAVGLDSIAVADRLSQAQRAALGLPDSGRSGALLPAPGTEFLLVHAADRTPAGGLPDAGDGSPTAAVLVGASTRQLSTGVPAANSVLVVSVPTGGGGALRVTDAGRGQSIDLRTGRPGPDVNPLFHPQWTATAQLSDLDRIDGIDRSIRVRLGLVVTLRPYLPGKGWAPAGRAWLAVDVTLAVQREVGLKLDLAKSLTLRTDGPLAIPGGTTLVAAPDPAGGTDLVARWSGGFNVPADLRAGTATFATVGIFTRPGTGATLGHTAHPVGGSVTLRLNPVS